jgi:hypothetical protein
VKTVCHTEAEVLGKQSTVKYDQKALAQLQKNYANEKILHFSILIAVKVV